MVGDGVDVEESRARDMRGEELLLGVAFQRREVKRPVDDADLGLAQPRCEPFGGNEILACGRAGLGYVFSVRAGALMAT